MIWKKWWFSILTWNHVADFTGWGSLPTAACSLGFVQRIDLLDIFWCTWSSMRGLAAGVREGAACLQSVRIVPIGGCESELWSLCSWGSMGLHQLVMACMNHMTSLQECTALQACDPAVEWSPRPGWCWLPIYFQLECLCEIHEACRNPSGYDGRWYRQRSCGALEGLVHKCGQNICLVLIAKEGGYGHDPSSVAL